MKLQEKDYYEKYWREESGDASFQDIPVWENMEDLKDMLLFFKEAINGKILDAGCGAGDWVFNLSQLPQVTHVTGVDISRNAVKECLKRAKTKKMSKKVNFVNSPMTKLPFKKNYFDNIFSIAVLEHMLDVDKTFTEFNRVLKRGGHIGVLTVDFNLLKMIIIGTFFFEKYFDPRSPHIRFFTKNTLKRLFEEHGFKVKKYKWTRSYFGLMPLAQLMLARKIKDV